MSQDTLGERKKAQPAEPVDDADQEPLLGAVEFREAFGENIESTLDIDKWSTGIDWESAVARFKNEISAAVGQEERLRQTIRREILPRLGHADHAPPEAGVYKAEATELDGPRQPALPPGRTEAVDGTSVSYDSLPLGITQIGIAVVSYGGTSATFAQRIFRKEIAAKSGDAYEEALDLIKRRDTRQGVGQGDRISELARRGIMTFAERKILLDKSSTDWRIGHGSPCPYELLTGSGSMPLLEASLKVLRRLIMEQKKFVFVPSAPGERALLTIGNALDAGEYAIFDSIKKKCHDIVKDGHYGKDHKKHAEEFVEECGPQVLFGMFRASTYSPPYLFYAHREHVHMAARIALADSILRPERGFPMLIDVADVTCRSAFGADGFLGLIHDAYARAGGTVQYFGERETRR